MTRGRKPIPAAIKLHEGNAGKRPIQNEPKPLSGLPVCPEYLDDVGQAVWQEVMKTMGVSGAITMAEGPLLELFCDTFSKYQQAREKVDMLGIALVTQDKDGKPVAKPNPFANQLHKYRDAATKLLCELGMTPVSRARIGLEKQSTDDFTSQYIS
jgi:P27 family predicted phage terminase small subunit